MTLKQALDLALQQNPDVVLARLDQQKARAQVTITHDPFVPKVYAGSGAAWTYGFPTSIEGNAPSIMEAKTTMSIFDRSQTYLVAASKESLRGMGIDVTARQEDAVFRVASLFLDAENASKSFAAAQQEAANLARVQQLVEARVQEGRELPISSKKANVAVLRGKQRVEDLELDVMTAETSLAQVLGLPPGDRVHAADQEERPALNPPTSEEEAIAAALEHSPELKRLESNLQAKTLEIKSYKAQKLPKVDLVAQYSLLAKFNNFQDYFTSFQHNNVELGASFQVPLFEGSAPKALASQAAADAAKIRVEVGRVRSRITADLQRAFQDMRRADDARDLARADLDLAREQTSIDLAQMDEGRTPAAQVEQDRAAENEKWQAYYDAQTLSERARLNLLHQTGTLLTALK